jgi:hypothetical protein
MFLRRRLPSRRGAKNLWASSSPYQKSSKSEGGRKKRGKTGWELARKAKELPPLLSLVAPVPQTSTGLPPIKLVGTEEEAVPDLRAQRNGKLAIIGGLNVLVRPTPADSTSGYGCAFRGMQGWARPAAARMRQRIARVCAFLSPIHIHVRWVLHVCPCSACTPAICWSQS